VLDEIRASDLALVRKARARRSLPSALLLLITITEDASQLPGRPSSLPASTWEGLLGPWARSRIRGIQRSGAGRAFRCYFPWRFRNRGAAFRARREATCTLFHDFGRPIEPPLVKWDVRRGLSSTNKDLELVPRPSPS